MDREPLTSQGMMHRIPIINGDNRVVFLGRTNPGQIFVGGFVVSLLTAVFLGKQGFTTPVVILVIGVIGFGAVTMYWLFRTSLVSFDRNQSSMTLRRSIFEERAIPFERIRRVEVRPPESGRSDFGMYSLIAFCVLPVEEVEITYCVLNETALKWGHMINDQTGIPFKDDNQAVSSTWWNE